MNREFMTDTAVTTRSCDPEQSDDFTPAALHTERPLAQVYSLRDAATSAALHAALLAEEHRIAPLLQCRVETQAACARGGRALERSALLMKVYSVPTRPASDYSATSVRPR